jgi:DNA-binding GntR family transcriptional regulator
MIQTATAFDYIARLETLKRLGPPYPLQWIEEHGEIVRALQSRDFERVEQLMRLHILSTSHYMASTADTEC